MHHLTYPYKDKYDYVILIKELRPNHIKPLILPEKGVVAFDLDYDKKIPSAQCRRDYLDRLLPEIVKMGFTQLIVADPHYFKTLTKQNKADPHVGSIKECKYPNFEGLAIVYSPNPASLMFNPDAQSKINLSLKALSDCFEGVYQELGVGITHFEEYPETYEEIKAWLNKLHTYPAVTADIEAYSLKHHDAGIGTISFAWSQHEGIAFSVDTSPCDPKEIEVWDKKDKKFKKRIAVNEQIKNEPVRALLKEFFETYKGKVIWHNASYDVNVLVYQLWMDSLIDREGLLTGLEVMTSNVEDTKIITYLATNSCAGNHLSLKEQAHEFAGDYAESDINDIRLIEPEKLLRYNLVDSLCTWYVMDKHYDTVVLDEQLEVYEFFKTLLVDIIDMQLTGICLDMEKVLTAEKTLQDKSDEAILNLNSTKTMKGFLKSYAKEAQLVEFTKRKDKAKKPEGIKIKPIDFFLDKPFNPNSGKQIQSLLYDYMEMPVIDLTDSEQPAVGGDTLKKLLNHVDTMDSLTPSGITEYKLVIQSLLDFVAVDKILGTFIKAYKESPKAPDGMNYLYGNFNLGGTKSGRLSSSNPNLQNQPSTGSPYAKLIKKCFVAPKGWIPLTLDYNSLEDYISALTTKDKNKLKVYTDGYDGHSLRGVSYFSDECPELQPVEEGTRVFKVTMEGEAYYLKCGTVVTCPNRGDMLVEDYFDGMA